MTQWTDKYYLLTEEDLASMENEEIDSYYRLLSAEAMRIHYGLITENSKFIRRIQNIREGKDPDQENPKKKPKKEPTRHRTKKESKSKQDE